MSNGRWRWSRSSMPRLGHDRDLARNPVVDRLHGGWFRHLGADSSVLRALRGKRPFGSRLGHEVPPRAVQRRSVEKPIVVPARGLAEVQAGHARAARVQASGVERTAMLVVHDGREQAVQVRFEDGLETAEDEIAAGGSVDIEAEVQRDQQLREGVAIGESRGQ